MLRRWIFKKLLLDPGSNLVEFYNYPAQAPSATFGPPPPKKFFFTMYWYCFLP